jgi:hypothetical protein
MDRRDGIRVCDIEPPNKKLIGSFFSGVTVSYTAKVQLCVAMHTYVQETFRRCLVLSPTPLFSCYAYGTLPMSPVGLREHWLQLGWLLTQLLGALNGRRYTIALLDIECYGGTQDPTKTAFVLLSRKATRISKKFCMSVVQVTFLRCSELSTYPPSSC